MGLHDKESQNGGEQPLWLYSKKWLYRTLWGHWAPDNKEGGEGG